MRACGQKFVNFCTLTHAAKLVVEISIVWEVLYIWKKCIVGILCSSSNANHIPLHTCLVICTCIWQ